MGLHRNRLIGVFVVCAMIGGFIVLTSEVREAMGGQMELIGKIDQWLLTYVARHRSPIINSVAIDLTAMGSSVVLVIIAGTCALFCALRKDIRAVVQLTTATAGAGILTLLLKSYFERSRPEAIFRVVDVQGFSYPSGHSLAAAAIYLSIAIVLCKAPVVTNAKFLLYALFLSLIFLIGMTRIYLGVHYFSDVTAGIVIGFAWAALVEIVGEWLAERSGS